MPPKGEPPDERTPPPWKRPASPEFDAYLHVWVYLANRHGTEVALSVLTRGIVVSGTTIAFDAWQRELESQIRTANTETSEAVGGLVEGLKEVRLQTTADSLIEDPDQPYWFVHLKDATVSGAGPPFKVPLWRGRLTAVDAWWMGA